MSNVAICATNLGKAYMRARGTRPGSCASSGNDIFWALRGLCLEIKHGDLVGIVGENGGGKTTLLRLLSRLTVPTEGYAEIGGPIGTLLEIGAGFQGELTGRENVYLRGRILGMSSREIRHRFDDIVGFSGLEEFIEMPLKRYSSGMCVRLAFAIAIHQTTEILLVDDVLALVDRAFESKCLERLIAAAQEGRTVLLVSHQLEFVRKLCRRGMVLSHGRIVYSGTSSEALDCYSSVSKLPLSTEASIGDEIFRGI